MKAKLSLLLIIVLSFSLYSCKNEYKRTDNGALMKFYEINKNNDKPEVGDLVLVDVVQKISDSVLFSSEMYGEPIEVVVEEPSFVGDIMSALLSMHINDHASLIFPVDSMFTSIGESLPEFIAPGTITEMDIVLKEIIKKEDLENQIREEMGMRKAAEDSLLTSYINNDRYKITEDSLIIVDIKNGNGEFAKAGNIMKVYFTFQILEGDTLLDFTCGKPYELVFGDMALGQGFYEGLSLVSKGGEAEFIIPSSLAWGSEGFQDVILPYTTFKFNVKVVDIMTSEEYENEQRSIQEKEQKENAQRLKEEPEKIAKYLKDNNINVNPTSSGLYYIEKEMGNGESPQVGNLVEVHYSIYDINNNLIESSLDYGQPIPFVYGKNQMILGIEEAVGYMKVGGKSRIIAPSNLGFGDIKIDENLPANSTLVIDLELVGLYDHQE
jgi:FKBP-type peptidyl-prolyl cis-trans isomerase